MMDQLKDKITMTAGTSRVLEIPFSSTALTKVKWTWAPSLDLTQEQLPRFKSDTVSGLTSLPLSRVRREDDGIYKCTISNEHGSISIAIRLVVLDKPDQPRNLQIKESDEQGVLLKWDKPKLVMDEDQLEYIVRYRDSARRTSQTVDVCVTEKLEALVNELQLGSQYIFSVCARNEIGESASIETEPILIKYNFNVPQAPGTPNVEVVETGTVLLRWDKPHSDGGSPITGYVVELCTERILTTDQKRSKRSSVLGLLGTNWSVISTGIQFGSDLNLPECKITGLSPDFQYVFRVSALNKAGQSPFGPPSDICVPVAKGPKVPNKPINLQCSVLSDTSVHLSWSPGELDTDNYGPATYFQIESSTDDESTWGNIGQTKTAELFEFEVCNLDSSNKYNFRVRGINQEGMGDPSKPTKPINLRKDAPMIFVRPLNSVVTNSIPQFVEFECELNKVPTKVQWFSAGKRLDSGKLSKYRFDDAEDGKIQKMSVLKVCIDDVAEYSIKIDNKLESKGYFKLESKQLIYLIG